MVTCVLCNYCQKPAERVTGYEIYPHRPDLYRKTFWRCVPCKAYVGCHKNSDTPLGRLANAELRKAKLEAHTVFDPLWRRGTMSRRHAYALLAQKMGIPANQAHIGMFDVPQCRQVKEIFEAYHHNFHDALRAKGYELNHKVFYRDKIYYHYENAAGDFVHITECGSENLVSYTKMGQIIPSDIDANMFDVL